MMLQGVHWQRGYGLQALMGAEIDRKFRLCSRGVTQVLTFVEEFAPLFIFLELSVASCISPPHPPVEAVPPCVYVDGTTQ